MTGLPATRWLSISLRVRLWRIIQYGGERAPLLPQTPPPLRGRPPLRGAPSPLFQRDPVAAAGALVVGARADQTVVVVLLDDVRAPARDAPGGDDRREHVHRNPECVEERRRIEV